MNKKHSGRLGAALVMLSLTFIIGLAAPDLSAASVTSKGKIKTIDLAKRTVNVQLNDGSQALMKVPLSASITRNGTHVQLNGLALADAVAIKYDSVSKNASSLKSTGPAVSRSNGSVKSVRDTAGTLKVGQKNFKTNAVTKIARNGRLVPLRRVTRHDSVVVHSKPSTTWAKDIVGNGPEECEAEGTITAINLDQGSVTIAPDNDTPEMLLYIDGSTIIEVDGVAVGMAALQVDMKAEVVYDPETFLAFSISVDTADDEVTLEGTVTGVDLNAGTITILPSWASAQCWVVLIVNASTEITVNNVAATLADVTDGMPVTAVYSESTKIAKSIAAGDGDDTDEGDADVEGTVTALGENSITITPEASVECTGEPVTLTVDGSTEILIDGVTGSFLDITIGEWAKAKYDSTTLLAKQIKVETSCEAAKTTKKK